jgi:hypothetical protein
MGRNQPSTDIRETAEYMCLLPNIALQSTFRPTINHTSTLCRLTPASRPLLGGDVSHTHPLYGTRESSGPW